jgi:hypothetical protein
VGGIAHHAFFIVQLLVQQQRIIPMEGGFVCHVYLRF